MLTFGCALEVIEMPIRYGEGRWLRSLSVQLAPAQRLTRGRRVWSAAARKRSSVRHLGGALILALLFAAGMAQGRAAEPMCAGEPVPAVAVTHHTGTFNGQSVHYAATVRANIVRDATGHGRATLVTISYVREGLEPSNRLRPVIFAFNGGPGAAAVSLNFLGFGPVVRAGSGTSATFSDNPYSLLDRADLVYVDPVGTGFSRPCDPESTYWYSQATDASSVLDVMQRWLKRNDREQSPVFLFGESYGTVRVGTILNDADKMRFTGVILDGLYVPRKDTSIVTYLTELPTMAAAAWYHGKIDRGHYTVEQWFKRAVKFANTTYITALVQGAALTPVVRKSVASQLSRFIGLPESLVESSNLRISKKAFMFSLLKGESKRTGMLDTRVVAPMRKGEQGGIDDPALGVVPEDYTGSRPITPADIGPVTDSAVGAYIRKSLQFPVSLKYYSINFSVNSEWKYDKAVDDSVAAIGRYIQSHPKLRVMVVQGIYDLTTPAYSALYSLRQDSRVYHNLSAFVLVPGPHAAYVGSHENLKMVSDAIRSFIDAR